MNSSTLTMCTDNRYNLLLGEFFKKRDDKPQGITKITSSTGFSVEKFLIEGKFRVNANMHRLPVYSGLIF